MGFHRFCYILNGSKNQSKRMHANVFLSSGIGRTHPNWSKTNRVCQKMTSPSLKRNFLENSILDDFQLSFPAENALKNHHFQKLKFWKKMQNFDFSKKLFRMILTMFKCKPFGLGIVSMCFFTLPAPESIFLAPRGIFLNIFSKVAIFDLKMPFFSRKWQLKIIQNQIFQKIAF